MFTETAAEAALLSRTLSRDHRTRHNGHPRASRSGLAGPTGRDTVRDETERSLTWMLLSQLSAENGTIPRRVGIYAESFLQTGGSSLVSHNGYDLQRHSSALQD